MHAIFTLAGQQFMCSDSCQHHEFSFTPSVSLFVDCADEAELDRLYAALREGRGAMPLGEYGFSRKFGGSMTGSGCRGSSIWPLVGVADQQSAASIRAAVAPTMAGLVACRPVLRWAVLCGALSAAACGLG